jgi:hypothetical protein
VGRLRRHASALVKRLDMPRRWSLEIAGLLSQVRVWETRPTTSNVV